VARAVSIGCLAATTLSRVVRSSLVAARSRVARRRSNLLTSTAMANDDTTTATVTFRRNHLVRLRGFNHTALDGKLVRIKSEVNEVNSKFEVAFLDDQARPPVPVIPARRMLIKPDNMRHACEFCLVAASAAVDGGRLQMCGRCKTARYCNAECQRADWARHKVLECIKFSHQRSKDMSTLLQACERGDVVEVRRLVEEEGADVDRATSNGPTPLAIAAHSGYISVVQYLVGQGADVDKARSTSFSPLSMAAEEGHVVIVQYLCEHGAVKDNARDGDGSTPLIIAALRGHLPVVRYLVEHGAEKDKAAIDGGTSLFAAASRKHFLVVQYLIERGADKDKARDNDGATPLCIAAQNGSLEVVRCLVEQGADKDKAAKNGLTPLLVATLRNELAVVRCLVEQGADKDKATSNGWSPLRIAQSKGYAEVAAYLRAAGAR